MFIEKQKKKKKKLIWSNLSKFGAIRPTLFPSFLNIAFVKKTT